MITTRHHSLMTRPHAWDEAHLYEHILIVSARDYFVDHGVSSDLFGWISGETFEERLFIDAGFYRKEVAELFDAYMEGPRNFSKKQVGRAMAMIEAEEKKRFVIDINDAVQRVAALDERPWNDLSLHEVSDIRESEHPLLVSSSRSFRDIGIEVSARNLALAEQKVFLRLRPILADILGNYVVDICSAYIQNTEDVVLIDNEISFSINCTVKGDIANSLQEYVANYPIVKYWEDFRTHFSVYAREPLWASLPVDYYRYTGIVTTNQEISDLATRECVEGIFQKVDVTIVARNA